MKRLTPIKAIRARCIFCSNNQFDEIKNCLVPECPLFPLRFGRRVKGISSLRSIRKYCYGCGEGTAFDIKNCEITDCSLYQLRFGKNPALKGKRGGGNPDSLRRYRLIQGNSSKVGFVEADANPKL